MIEAKDILKLQCERAKERAGILHPECKLEDGTIQNQCLGCPYKWW